MPACHPFWLRSFTMCAILLATSIQGAGLTLSGQVLDLDSSARSGVVVTLASSGESATTDSRGAWSLGTGTTGTSSRFPSRRVSSNLLLVAGRLRLSFQGHDLSGRRSSESPSGAGASSLYAQRALASVDTLVYSADGKVFLRDTVSGSRTGIVRLFDTTWNAKIIYGWLEDARDGQLYRTVAIGSQTWMAQNLNFRVDSSWWYGNSADSGFLYGRMYPWTVALGLDDSCARVSCSTQVGDRTRGLCPTGWHVPSLSEWMRLCDTTLVSLSSGKELKASQGWLKGASGTDVYGFRALPGAIRTPTGNVGGYGTGTDGYWWISTENNAGSIWVLGTNYAGGAMMTSNDNAAYFYFEKAWMLQIRCLAD